MKFLNKLTKEKYKENRLLTGFTLLFTLLVISIVLAVSLGISSLIIREIGISGTARESKLAFFAADSILDCVRYWDYKFPDAFNPDPPTFTISCNNQSFEVGGSNISIIPPVNMGSNLSDDSLPCARAIIEKDGIDTLINAFGLNTCTGGGKSLERGRFSRYSL